jgi:hypothetical protein
VILSDLCQVNCVFGSGCGFKLCQDNYIKCFVISINKMQWTPKEKSSYTLLTELSNRERCIYFCAYLKKGNEVYEITVLSVCPSVCP